MTAMLLTGPDLKSARMRQAVTQQELAARMGVNVATVSRLEGKYALKPATARRYLDALATFPSLTSPAGPSDAA